MNEGDVSGLVGSVGLHLARLHDSSTLVARMEHARSPKEFRATLEAVDLGLAPPATRAFIDHVTGDGWDAYRWRLVRAWGVAYNNRLFPGS